jgi:hypothetical protein
MLPVVEVRYGTVCSASIELTLAHPVAYVGELALHPQNIHSASIRMRTGDDIDVLILSQVMDSSFPVVNTFIMLVVAVESINLTFVAPPEAPAILMGRLCSETPLISLVLIGDIVATTASLYWQ